MSNSSETGGSSHSNNNWATIFQAAVNEYETVTGIPLHTHPFATQLDNCDSLQAVSNVFQSQAQAFRKIRKGDEELMEYLGQIVQILLAFSGTLGEGIGLVSHFTQLV